MISKEKDHLIDFNNHSYILLDSHLHKVCVCFCEWIIKNVIYHWNNNHNNNNNKYLIYF